MSARRMGSPTALILGLGIGWLMAAPASGQVRAVPSQPKDSTPTKSWSPPLTPDGHPDFQGVWVNNSTTPLERPRELEGRQSLTDEEVATLKSRAGSIPVTTTAISQAGTLCISPHWSGGREGTRALSHTGGARRGR